jgi:acylphosphatase
MSEIPVSLQEVQSAIGEAGHRWRPAHTSVAELSHEEALLRLGYTPGAGEPSLAERESRAVAAVAAEAAAPTAPTAGATVDWRNFRGYNWVSPVVDQGGCGSCVAFGSCATAESAIRIACGNPSLAVKLSEAQLFYCVARSQGRMCEGPNGGWFVPPAMAALQYPGIADSACYPYTGADQNCTSLCPNWRTRVSNITGWHPVTSVAQMKLWLATRGPMVTCFTVYNDFYYYSGGVYEHTTGGVAGGHCVCVIGYDDNQGAWICKNSWGTGWGESGFFLIAYGQCGIDAEMYAIEGAATPTPALAHNADGRLEVFTRGPDKAMWHSWQTAPNGNWSGWASLGGGISSAPAYGRNADGRIEMFARGMDGALWHMWQTAPNNGWSGWASLGGLITSDPVVVNNADGRLEVFARGTDDALWHIWQTAPNNGWSGWASLGGQIYGDPVVGHNADGRLEAFVMGTDRALWHIWQTAPNGNWSGWKSEGGILASDPVVSRNADGRMEVFVRGTDDAVWHIWQTAPNGNWSGWASLGGIIIGRPSVGRNADGRMEVFAIGTDRAVWHIWQTAPSNGWSGWASLGGTVTTCPVVTNDADGRMEVFARGTDGALWHIWQTAPSNGWSGWASMGTE